MNSVLIEEVPADADAESTLIGGVMRSKEITAGTAVDVTEHDIETAGLKMEVCIDVDPRVVADANAVVGILNSILADEGIVGRGVVLCKEAHITAQIGAQYFCDLEMEIEIRPNVEERERENL